MMKRVLTAVLAAAMVLALTACGGSDGVTVQRADQLAASTLAGERFAGMVVSQNVVEIQRDSTKTVEQVYVTLGQRVNEGDKLFTYDSDALQLDLEKLQLEIDKINNENVTYTEQLEKLEKQLKNTWNESAKVRLTLEINTLKTTMMEAEYNLKGKEQEKAKLEEMLQNVDVVAPVSGTIRKLNEKNEEGPYITIQQSGAYRVKGNLNEMNMGSGMMVGTRVKVISRLDPKKFWMGTVDTIDMEGGQNNNNDGYGGMMGGFGPMGSEMTGTSNYPFYVTLDNTDGILLGQHVYMEAVNEEQSFGLMVPDIFLTEITTDAETGASTAQIWAEGANGKLEKRTVELGFLDSLTGCYEILSGLEAGDYVADPADPGCRSGAAVSRRNPSDFAGQEAAPDATEMPGEDNGAVPEVPEDVPEVSAENAEIPADIEAPAAEG